MSFTIPNEADAFNTNQAEPDKIDIDILVAGLAGDGVVNGCLVTAQGPPDLTVAVAAGRVIAGGTSAAVAAGNVTITAADGTNPRIDLIVSNNSGAKSAVAGTAADEPVMPAIPASSVVLAAIYIPASDTDIDANQITDKRAVLLNRTLIEDEDQDTAWEAEQSADEDKLRAKIAGTERVLVQVPSGSTPAIKITDTLEVTDRLAIGTTLSTNVGINQVNTFTLSITENTGVGLALSVTDNGSDAGAGRIKGFTEKVTTSRSGGSVVEVTGFTLDTDSLTARAITDMRALIVNQRDLAATTIARLTGLEFNTPTLVSATPTDSRQIWIKPINRGTNVMSIDIEAIAGGTNRYGLRIADITGGTIARMIDAAVFQIRGSGEYTDAANETPMFLNEGATPTLRQVKWKAGDVLGSGDKVMVLV